MGRYADDMISMTQPPEKGPEHDRLVSLLSASLAETLGAEEIRIRQIRRLADKRERSQLLAAISAALGEELGQEAEGLRILAVRRV